MMPQNSLPNPANDLVRIHKAISRGITVALTNGTRFNKDGFPDAGTQEGFVRYTQSLVIVLTAHHGSEDEIAFPALKLRLPTAPYERLSATHQNIATCLDMVRKAMGDMPGESTEVGLGIVIEGLKKISSLWSPHIHMEERHFGEEAIGAVMTPEEQAQVSISMAKHSQEHAVPPYLALPFVLFNLPADDRASMAETLPKIVIEELIPKEWKDQWAPMKPFLLD
jgi:hypothetical protein